MLISIFRTFIKYFPKLFAFFYNRTYLYDFEHIRVTLGANNRLKNESFQQIINVTAIISHTEHQYYKKNDIALLQLSTPVTYTNYIQPICMPAMNDELPLYSTCYTVGWGHTSWAGKFQERPQIELSLLKVRLHIHGSDHGSLRFDESWWTVVIRDSTVVAPSTNPS